MRSIVELLCVPSFEELVQRRHERLGPTWSELDTFDLPPFGRVEAGHAAGGLSTLAESYRGKVKTMFNKFLRYPGHIPAMESMRAMGFFDLEPFEVRPWEGLVVATA